MSFCALSPVASIASHNPMLECGKEPRYVLIYVMLRRNINDYISGIDEMRHGD